MFAAVVHCCVNLKRETSYMALVPSRLVCASWIHGA